MRVHLLARRLLLLGLALALPMVARADAPEAARRRGQGAFIERQECVGIVRETRDSEQEILADPAARVQ